MREKLPDERKGFTHHFTIFAKKQGEDGIEEHDGYVTSGEYPDGRVGEIFLRVGKAGSSDAMADQWAINFSYSLQHGVPLEDICRKFVGQRFEPSGRTKYKDIPTCTGLTDYVSRWLLLKYGSEEARKAMLALAHENQGEAK